MLPAKGLATKAEGTTTTITKTSTACTDMCGDSIAYSEEASTGISSSSGSLPVSSSGPWVRAGTRIKWNESWKGKPCLGSGQPEPEHRSVRLTLGR